MNNSEKEFMILAVKRLFERIKRGDVHFAETVPQTLSEIKAVRFDGAGSPFPRPSVRWCARLRAELLGTTSNEKPKSANARVLYINISANPWR